MTVRALPALVRYTGDGATDTFAWDWDMISDSSINVMVDNYRVSNWTLQGQTVVFTTPPVDGAEIIIYRRTKIWQPDDYRAFGRFHSEKTELTMDRHMLIAQERQGDSEDPLQPNGIVGGSDLSIIRNEFNITLVSERGTDAILPMYNPTGVEPPPPNPPDPSILWTGSQIDSGIYSLPGATDGVTATIRFRLDLTGGDTSHASAFYPNYNVDTYVSWLNTDTVNDAYWMRVTETSGLTASRYTINDGVANQSAGVAFKMTSADNVLGPYVSVTTVGDTAPITRTGIFNIEICKDDGGAPDEGWSSRVVSLRSIYNSDDPVPPDPDITGAISWQDFFGTPFGSPVSDATRIIEQVGAAIWFTVPLGSTPVRVSFTSIEVTGVDYLTRTGALNTTVLDFTTPPTYTWGIGGGINAGINTDAYDIELIPGGTYIFNIRNNTPPPTGNYVRVQVGYQENP